MDIRKQSVDPITFLHLKDADDELLYEPKDDGSDDKDKPLRVKLFTPAAKQFQRALAAKNNRLMARMRRKSGKADMSADEQIEERAQFLADITAGWEYVEYGDITELSSKSLAIYKDTSLGFFADQVEKHIGDWANFSKSAPTA